MLVVPVSPPSRGRTAGPTRTRAALVLRAASAVVVASSGFMLVGPEPIPDRPAALTDAVEPEREVAPPAPPSAPTTVAPVPGPAPDDAAAFAEPTPRPGRIERCLRALAASGLTPAPGFTIGCGPSWNSGADGWTDYYCTDLAVPHTCTGTISIHPDDDDSDAFWVGVVRHEIGHSWCIRTRGDFSEECAAGYE